MEDQPHSDWEELLEIYIAEVLEHRKVINRWLDNVERSTNILERGLANLVTQVGMLEFNIGILATAIGSKHTTGMLCQKSIQRESVMLCSYAVGPRTNPRK